VIKCLRILFCIYHWLLTWLWWGVLLIFWAYPFLRFNISWNDENLNKFLSYITALSSLRFLVLKHLSPWVAFACSGSVGPGEPARGAGGDCLQAVGGREGQKVLDELLDICTSQKAGLKTSSDPPPFSVSLVLLYDDVGINRRLLLGSTVSFCWDQPSAFAGIERKLQGELC
jgi:hypothetical protein